MIADGGRKRGLMDGWMDGGKKAYKEDQCRAGVSKSSLMNYYQDTIVSFLPPCVGQFKYCTWNQGKQVDVFNNLLPFRQGLLCRSPSTPSKLSWDSLILWSTLEKYLILSYFFPPKESPFEALGMLFCNREQPPSWACEGEERCSWFRYLGCRFRRSRKAQFCPTSSWVFCIANSQAQAISLLATKLF